MSGGAGAGAPAAVRRLAALAAAGAAVLALAGCVGHPARPLTPAEPPPPPPQVADAVPVVPAAPLPEEPPPPIAEAPAPRPLPELPLVVRVGLASDLARLDLPCCSGGLVLSAGEERLPLTAPVSVEPASGRVEAPVYRLQVAALGDGRRAAELARRLGVRHGMAAEALWDEAAGLHRVRLGRFATREAAEVARRRLEAAGLAGSWVVGEGGAIEHPALRLTAGARAFTAPGRWLRVSATAGAKVSHAGRRYRGDLLVFLNPRGLLNVINELPLEDYLRGVVPGEMGPEQFPRIEALKAQAVAARTYALRNLGELRAEGYDLCATPRCQVYGGMAVEHPLSDRAIAETAGQVMIYQGELVDARYSATCGGHTEDGDVVFPHSHAPYLHGVPCVEGGTAVVEGDLLEGAPFPEALSRRLVPAAETDGTAAGAEAAASAPNAAELVARLDLLVRRLPPRLAAGDGALGAEGSGRGRAGSAAAGGGAAVRPRRATDLRRRADGLAFAAAGPAVAPQARSAAVAAAAAAPTAAWLGRQIELRWGAGAAADAVAGLPAGRALTAAEIEGALLRLATVLGLVEERRGAFLSRRGDALVLRGPDGGEESWPLPAELATFRRRGAGRFATDLALLPGDPVTLWIVDGRLFALVQEVDPREVAFDRPQQFASWRRTRSERELARRAAERYPGLELRSIEIVSRGVSGRVAVLRLHGAGGRSVDVEGLAVRWVLDLPDTRFEVERVPGGYSFRGSGWGHGVGMCQVGSFGMAGRGADYRAILEHYYRGVELVVARPAEPAWTEPALAGFGGE